MNPPTWAHHATPPDAAAASETVPASACWRNHNPRNTTAGTLKKNGMIADRQEDSDRRARIDDEVRPENARDRPRGPDDRHPREGREPHLRLRRDDAGCEIERTEASAPDAAFEPASEHPEVEHVPEEVRPPRMQEHRRQRGRDGEDDAPGRHLARRNETPGRQDVLERARRERPFAEEDRRRSRRPRGTSTTGENCPRKTTCGGGSFSLARHAGAFVDPRAPRTRTRARATHG